MVGRGMSWRTAATTTTMSSWASRSGCDVRGSILVTGGAGFIGSHVAEALALRGESVVAVDSFVDSYSLELKRANVELLRKQGVRFIQADICDRDAMRAVVEENKVSRVCHMAARAGVRASLVDPAAYVRANIEGTAVLLDVARNCDNVVVASSSSVYGNHSADRPSVEPDADTAVQASPYAASKRAMEVMAAAVHNVWSLPISVLRFFTVYGPRGRPDMAPYIFMDKISRGQMIYRFGDGTSSRDYTYVGDVVAGVLAALDKPLGYEAFNIGAHSPVTLSEFIEAVEAAVGQKADILQKPPQVGDVIATWADITKANALLGYLPKVNLKQGLQATAEWYKSSQLVHAKSAVR
eukprot:jgi/Chlat1/8734/Chrsp9S09299